MCTTNVVHITHTKQTVAKITAIKFSKRLNFIKIQILQHFMEQTSVFLYNKTVKVYDVGFTGKIFPQPLNYQ